MLSAQHLVKSWTEDRQGRTGGAGSPQPSVVHVGVSKLGEPRCSAVQEPSPSCMTCRRPSRTQEQR